MTPLPDTAEIHDIARRVVWFEPPEKALSDPVRFAAYAMTYAGVPDIKVLLRYWTDDDLAEALASVPPGIMDARSWAYWHVKIGRYPPPPMPTRVIPG